MSKLIKLKSLAVMAMCAMGAFFAASCTSDEFFGIEEEADAVAFSTLTKIANSAEYLEYQEQAFLAQQAIAGIDTTKKVQVCEIDGKPIFATESVSIQGALDARQKLVEAYPEFEKTTAAEKNQILNIAMMNNKSLRSIAPTSAINMTKGSWYETEASRYAMDTYERYPHLMSTTWHVEDSYFTAVNWAISENEMTGRLTGGFEFDDGSGIYVEDNCATSNTVNLSTYTTYGSNSTLKPRIAFVIVGPNNSISAAYECARGADTWCRPIVTIYVNGSFEYYSQK